MKARLFKAQRFNPPGPSWFLLLEDGTEVQAPTENRAYEIAIKLGLEVVTTTQEID